MMKIEEVINRLQILCKAESRFRDSSSAYYIKDECNKNIEAINFAISTLESVLHGHK